MVRTAFVTGGTGFIGRRVVKLLVEDSWNVRLLILESDRAPNRNNERIATFVGDVTRPETLHGTMDGVDAVFHVAALVDSWIRNSRDFFRVNVEGTENVIGEALRAGVPRFVFTSSLSGIGVTPREIMREDSPPGKAFGHYEESKAEAERLVARAVRERGLPAIILVPGIVVGPGDARNTGKFLLSFAKGEFPGTFAETSLLPVVDVDDVARAHLLAYERGRVGERYIISAQNVAWIDLLRFASAASGTPMPSRHLGARTLWLASRTGEALARVTRSPPRLPAWLADFLLTGAPMDNTKSIRELGMTYRPVGESIRDAVKWFREEGLFAGPLKQGAPSSLNLPEENPAVPGDSMSPPGTAVPHETAGSKDRRPKPPGGQV
jgi:dihydroflavonol-4-reductase